MKVDQRAFTIVELLIVIVVIAILAAISIVAYNGIQSRAKDSQMASAMNQLEKSIRLWYADTGEYPRGGWSSTTAFSGTNCQDGTGGWIFRGAYSCSLENILISKDLIPSGFTRSLPPNSEYSTSYQDGALSVMFYPCNDVGEYALYWHLRSPTPAHAASINSVESAGCPVSPRSTYLMKAARLIQL